MHLPPPRSTLWPLQAIGASALCVAHSIRERGVRHTLLFASLGVGLPVAGEYVGINVLRVLRHHTLPQISGVPLPAALGWYNIGYTTFAMLESELADRDLSPQQRRLVLPIATAISATSFDLLLDCFGLDHGLWEWNADGSYAPHIVGPNGKRGIPLGNFAAWLVLTSSVTALYLRLSTDNAIETENARSGRDAALIVLPMYLGAALWAIRQQQWRPLLSSVPFLLVLVRALFRDR